MEKIKNRLKELREPLRYTQQDMANVLGIARSTYTSYEIGKIEIPLEKLQKLANQFHVTIDYLVGNDQKFIVWKSPLSFHHMIKKRRREMKLDIPTIAKYLEVTPAEITELEKGLLFPANIDVVAQIKKILKLEDSDLFSSETTSPNSHTVELEKMVKERDYHLTMVQVICNEYEEKIHYTIGPDGEDISKTVSPIQQAKNYLLKELDSLTLEELTKLFKYSYSQKVNLLIDEL